MPEIAALAGLERLDMMLNDSMYGILFRDINPIRTFVDQRFSRQVHARAGIIINTGEDNYLTTADAVEAAHTVTTSQLLNEYFAKEAGLEDWQLGLGHAFEINPDLPDSFRLELAHALLARTLFPEAPLKWMPPTKHMTGDIFGGYLLDGFFNLAGALTGRAEIADGLRLSFRARVADELRALVRRNCLTVLDAHPSPTRVTCGLWSSGEAEGRVLVCHQGDGVADDPVVPADHALHEVEDSPRVPAGEQDREPRDDHHDDGGEVEKREHDEVGDGHEDLHQRKPPVEISSNVGIVVVEVHGLCVGG